MRKHIGVQPPGLQSSDLPQPSIVDVATSPVEPIKHHSVKFAAVVQGAVPDILASVTDGQAVPSEADKTLPSAAAFRDASIRFIMAWCRWRCWVRSRKTGLSSSAPS